MPKLPLLDIFWQHGTVVHGRDSRTLNEVQHATCTYGDKIRIPSPRLRLARDHGAFQLANKQAYRLLYICGASHPMEDAAYFWTCDLSQHVSKLNHGIIKRNEK
jgi:hypothetical protein